MKSFLSELSDVRGQNKEYASSKYGDSKAESVQTLAVFPYVTTLANHVTRGNEVLGFAQLQTPTNPFGQGQYIYLKKVGEINQECTDPSTRRTI